MLLGEASGAEVEVLAEADVEASFEGDVRGLAFCHAMPYKGYDGSVLYSAEDKLLHGRILGIRDFVIYDGADVLALEKN